MNKYLIHIFLLLILLSGCSASRKAESGRNENTGKNPSALGFSAPDTWLLGYVNPVLFDRPPHSEWYRMGSDNYSPDQEAVTKLAALLIRDDVTVKIVLGTWCPDSRREVPRFMKIIDLLGFPAEKLTFIGVDNTKNSPVGEYESLGIERVPTFIFYRNKIEAGRIIENPVTSLEQDMVNILTRNEE